MTRCASTSNRRSHCSVYRRQASSLLMSKILFGILGNWYGVPEFLSMNHPAASGGKLDPERLKIDQQAQFFNGFIQYFF